MTVNPKPYMQIRILINLQSFVLIYIDLFDAYASQLAEFINLPINAMLSNDNRCIWKQTNKRAMQFLKS